LLLWLDTWISRTMKLLPSPAHHTSSARSSLARPWNAQWLQGVQDRLAPSRIIHLTRPAYRINILPAMSNLSSGRENKRTVHNWARPHNSCHVSPLQAVAVPRRPVDP